MRSKISWLALALFAFLALNQRLSYGEDDELSELVNSKDTIKVHISGYSNESGHEKIESEDFKKSVENALRQRKSVNFQIVNTPEESDVQISGTIKKYQYLERGPMKVNPSPTGILLDMAATATANYVEMEIESVIKSTKTDKILWKDKVSAYIKKVMTPEESIPLIYDKMSRMFLWKSFGKPSASAINKR